jgi:multiple sugar transport system substrate-binding protein
MTKTVLRGLTWGHRRATGPLIPLTAAFQQRYPDIEVEWIVRPLSDFEHQGLPGLASVYDLIIYDHPFSGSIVETGAFEPLSSHPELQVALADSHRYLGQSLLSYRFGGTVWGLPIDAATQHSVYRADLLANHEEAVPVSWHDAIALGQRLRGKGLSLGLAVKTPHAILTIAALMANLGSPWETSPDGIFSVDGPGFEEAYGQMRALLAFCPEGALAWNAIDLHEAMVQTDAFAYCPCVYGYGTYGEADQRHPLSFGDFAGLTAPYYAGSVLGGTGLAISRASGNKAAALSFVAFASSEEGQRLMTDRHGQPGLAVAWYDAKIDRRFNGFFSGARRSVETAWMRPRHRGYIDFQARAGEVVAHSLRAGDGAANVWSKIEPLLAMVNT